jgi:hypothetical protein
MKDLIYEMASVPGLAVALQNVLDARSAAEREMYVEAPIEKPLPANDDNRSPDDGQAVEERDHSFDTEMPSRPMMSHRMRRELERKEKKNICRQEKIKMRPETGQNRTQPDIRKNLGHSGGGLQKIVRASLKQSHAMSESTCRSIK